MIIPTNVGICLAPYMLAIYIRPFMDLVPAVDCGNMIGRASKLSQSYMLA